MIIESVSIIKFKLACVYSEDSNQSAHQHHLIRVLDFRKNNVGPLVIHRAPIKNSK